MSALMADIKRWMQTQRIVVLASGDPLFFGIGQRLIQSLGAENVVLFPNVTSVAAAFARVKLPWQDAKIVSLHGRQNESDLHRAMNTAEIMVTLEIVH